MKQLPLIPGFAPKEKRKPILKPKPKRLRASYGFLVPVPTHPNGEEMRIGSLRLLQRTDGRYVVWNEDSELGEGVLHTGWDKWEMWSKLCDESGVFKKP